MSSIAELLNNATKLLEEAEIPVPKEEKKFRCKQCKKRFNSLSKGRCEKCIKDHTVYNGKGYAYVYRNGKVTPKGRALVEEREGRKLEDFEVVLFIDDNKRNFDLDNLEIGLKGGIPVGRLQCTACGVHGQIHLAK